jgi:methionyl-tRNA synthetase
LGHLSGPYLGLDVFRRYKLLRGARTVSAVSIDTNQSYVVTTAERLGMSPDALVAKSYAEISATFARAEILPDVVGAPDAAYQSYVRDWFSRFAARGLLQARKLSMPFDTERGRFLFESYVKGLCPHCLAGTNGNICEDCGHPNDPDDLIEARVANDGSAKIERRECLAFHFDLEPWRADLTAFFERTKWLRPSLTVLLEELFAKRLPIVPITFPSAWGIPAPFPGAEGLVLNVWAEMLPGHYYWLEQAFSRSGGHGRLLDRTTGVEYVQYLGFDNSFYYAALHLGLAFAARANGIKALLPTRLHTNEFYQLGAHKFSTSQGHVIWARDFLGRAQVDEVRFYLSRTNPETQRTTFDESEYERTVGSLFRHPWTELEGLAKVASTGQSGPLRDDPKAIALLKRFERAYASPSMSLRAAADAIEAGLLTALAAARKGDPIKALASVLAVGAAPIAPNASLRLWRTLGHAGEPSWPDSDPSNAGREPLKVEQLV